MAQSRRTSHRGPSMICFGRFLKIADSKIGATIWAFTGYSPAASRAGAFSTTNRCQPKSAGLSVSTKEDCWFAAENLKLAGN
jgi:hypothetical protein